MYRSLYSYASKEKGALPFRAGEQFWFMDQHDEHWWKMKSASGEIGLVPASYLVPMEYVSKNNNYSAFPISGECCHFQSSQFFQRTRNRFHGIAMFRAIIFYY